AKKPISRLVISRKVQRLKAFAKIPDFQGKPTESPNVAQPAWRWDLRISCGPITSVFPYCQVYLLLLLYIFRKPAGSKSRDSVSQKNSRAQLAADGRHARACDLWRDRHLSPALHAGRSSGCRILLNRCAIYLALS